MVSGVGAGFMLISRRVMDAVPFRRAPEAGLDFSWCSEARQKGFTVYADLGSLCVHQGRNIEVWQGQTSGWTDLYYRVAPIMEDHYRQYLLKNDPDRLHLARFTRLNVGCGDKPFNDPFSVNVDLVERDAPNFRVADAEDLPFPDQSFDLVYSQNCVEHCEDPVKATSELLRVSKDRVEMWLPEYGEHKGLADKLLSYYPFPRHVEHSFIHPIRKQYPRTFIAWHKT
jgi:SAM-dependent methyltransferase